VDFSDQDDIRMWLADKPRDVALAFAARAVLRIIPMLVGEIEARAENEAHIGAGLILPVLRAAAVSWVASRYFTRNDDLRPDAAGADNAIYFTLSQRIVKDVALAAGEAATLTASPVDRVEVATGRAASVIARAAASAATIDLAAKMSVIEAYVEDAHFIYHGEQGAWVASNKL
jgi:hypothetical protein